MKRIPRVGALLKEHFLAGILILIPLGVIAWIIVTALNALWGMREILPDPWRPENFLADSSLATLLNILFTLGGMIVLAFGISLFGWASKQYVGRKLLGFLGDVIEHIPVVRSVYSALDQLMQTFSAGGGQQFSRVVYVEYPRKGVWTLAFVTGPARGPAVPTAHLNVYVPTTPNPTSGFYLIVPESEVRESGMRVEDAFKTILSLGIAQPGTGANTVGGTTGG